MIKFPKEIVNRKLQYDNIQKIKLQMNYFSSKHCVNNVFLQSFSDPYFLSWMFSPNAVTYRPAKLRIRTLFRGASRGAATSKIERFVTIVNGFQPLTIITKRSILDAAAALDPPLLFTQSNVKWKAKNSELYNIHWKMFKIINSIFHSFILLLCFCFVFYFLFVFCFAVREWRGYIRKPFDTVD